VSFSTCRKSTAGRFIVFQYQSTGSENNALNSRNDAVIPLRQVEKDTAAALGLG